MNNLMDSMFYNVIKANTVWNLTKTDQNTETLKCAICGKEHPMKDVIFNNALPIYAGNNQLAHEECRNNKQENK